MDQPHYNLTEKKFAGMRWLSGLVATFELYSRQPGLFERFFRWLFGPIARRFFPPKNWGRWEGISGGNGVLVLAFTPKGKLILVRQFRMLVGSYAVELPGGAIGRGEDLGVAIRRELLEETGYSCDGVVRLLVSAWLWNAKSNATVDIYIAEGCEKASDPVLDPVEAFNHLTVCEISLAELLGRMAEGDPEFRDPTLAHALLIWLRKRERIIP